jgi:hypothetical protein
VVGCVHLVMQRPGVILKLLSNKKPIIKKEQQVNLFLVEPDVYINENFILSKSWCICILRFE